MSAEAVAVVQSVHGPREVFKVDREWVAVCQPCGEWVARSTAKRDVVGAAGLYSSRHNARHQAAGIAAVSLMPGQN